MGINLNYGNVEKNIARMSDYMNGSEEGKKCKQDCEDALLQWDTFNDGTTSKGEFTVQNSYLTSNIFSDNEELYDKAKEITDAENDLYVQYAGDDGILSAEEYNACLQSEENGILLDGFLDLKNQNASLKGDTEHINLQQYDIDGDGKTSAKEIYKSRLDNAKKLYGKNSKEYKEIKKDAKAEYKLLKSGSNNKKDITNEEYAAARQIKDASSKNSFFAKLFKL